MTMQRWSQGLRVLARVAGLALLTAVWPVLRDATATAQGKPPADTLWRYRATADIARIRECESAELLLTVKSSLIALDAQVGTQQWELAGLPSTGGGLYWPCRGATGLSYRGTKLVAFDLVSGERRWDASRLPQMREIRGYVVLSSEDLLLLFLRTQASAQSLVAFRLSTGEQLWQRDDLLQQPVKFSAREGVSDIAEFQVFIADTDSTLILWVNADGPSRLDRRTGATLWRAEELAGPRVPHVATYAAMRLADSMLIVPRDKGVIAIRREDGRIAWRADDLLPRNATRFYHVPAGLVVRAGRNWVTVLDPATGNARWPAPLTVTTDGAAYVVTNDRYYTATGNRLLAADFATGDTVALADLPFSDKESPERMFTMGESLIVVSRQNLLRVGIDGALRYHHYYPAPGPSFFEVLGGIAPGASFGAAALRPEYAYFVTSLPDTTGRKGNSLVRVALDDGREAGRLWFKTKSPRFFPDPGRDQVLVLRDNKTLAALRFSTPRDGSTLAVTQDGMRR